MKTNIISNYIKISNKKQILSLLLLFINFSKLNIEHILEILKKKDKNDLYYFQKIIYIDKNVKNYDNSIIHSKTLYYILLKYNKNILHHKNINILDYGCGNCTLGNHLAKLLKQNISYGVDIDNWSENFKNNNKNLIFKNIKENKKIPFNDKFFNIIIISMVLHHVKNIDFVLKEIYRLLNDNAILIIREHDAVNIQDHCLIELQHYIYMYTTYKNKIYKENKNYYSNYKSIKEWKELIKKYKFKNIQFQYEFSNHNRPEIKNMRQAIIICQK